MKTPLNSPRLRSGRILGTMFLVPVLSASAVYADEIVGRFSQLMLDTDDGDTREREWGAGLNIYHRGHNWKTRFNVLRRDLANAHDIRCLIEHHVQF